MMWWRLCKPDHARALLLALAAALAPVAASAGDPERGKIVFALAGGCGCHTSERGPIGAGGRRLATPFGTFYGTNITPDPDTGIGRWSEEEIIAAIRDGYVRGKGVEAPVMPYYLYAGMADRDVRDLVAYLRTLPAVRRENQSHEVPFPFQRLAYRIWRFLFAPEATELVEPPQTERERGRYLADQVAICTDCHTPRGRFGVLRQEMYLAGTPRGPDGNPVPNITPDQPTGIGDWDTYDITQVLKRGMLPNFDSVQGLMAEVVDGIGGGPGYSSAPESDLRAIATYLETIEPVRHDVTSE